MLQKLFAVINLSFTDYLLMAVILTLFHVINVIEVLSIKKEDQEPYYAADLRFLAGISFIGIVCTIVCGLVAQMTGGLGDALLMLIPIAFIFFWAYNQRKFSRFMNYEKIDRRVNEEIKNIIENYAFNRGGFDLVQLEEDFKGLVMINNALGKVRYQLSRNKYIPYFLVEDIVERLSFQKGRIDVLLMELCSEQRLYFSNELYYPGEKEHLERKSFFRRLIGK